MAGAGQTPKKAEAFTRQAVKVKIQYSKDVAPLHPEFEVSGPSVPCSRAARPPGVMRANAGARPARRSPR